MLNAVADAALRRPRATLAALAAVLVLAAALAAAAPDRLAPAPPEASGSESERAADQLGAALGHEPGPGMLVVTKGRQPVRSAVYGIALDVITSRLEANPDVAEVRRGPVSRDERTTALEVYFREDDPGGEQQAVADLQDLDPGPLEVAIGGQAGVLHDAQQGLWDELGTLERLALPVCALVLAIAFGLPLFAGPLLAAAIGVLGSMGLMGLLSELTPLSAVGIAAAAVIAIGMAIEACLVLAARYREEAMTLGHSEVALRRTVEVAGRAVVIATLAATAVAASLAAIPVLDARSTALAGGLAAVLSGGTALTAMPCILVLARPGAAPRAAAVAGGEGSAGDFWYRVTSAITRQRLTAGALAAGAIVTLTAVAAPSLRTDTVPLDAAGLPDDAEAHRAELRATVELGSGTTAPVLISTDATERVELNRFSRELRSTPGVADAEGPTAAGEKLALVRAGTEARPGSLGAREATANVRDTASLPADVGGRDAEALDVNRSLLVHLPIVAGAAAVILAAVVFLVLRPALRTPRAAGSAAVLAIVSKLPAAAAGGLLVLVFQDGRLAGLLSYTPEGGPVLGAVIAVLGAVATVSAARTVHFAAAVAAEREHSFGSTATVPIAASLTLPGFAASTAVVAATAIVLVGSDLVGAKELGVGVAAGVILDLVFVRALIGTGLARLSQ